MEITWPDFEKVDIRVGTVVDALAHEKARNPALKIWIDFGALGVRQSSAQITHHYQPEDLIGKQVVGVVNFPPKLIGGFTSECLVLGIYGPDGTVVLIKPDFPMPNGSKIG